jgi:hypothetical protein
MDTDLLDEIIRQPLIIRHAGLDPASKYLI